MRTAILHNFLIEATMMASIAIILMMILRKTLRRPLGNNALCFGWGLVAARLLLPISLYNPLIHNIRSPFAVDAAIRPIAGQVLVRTRDAIDGANLLLWRSGSRLGTEVTERLISSIDYGTAGTRLMQLYFIGAALVLGWFIFSNVRFRLKLRAGQIEPISGKLLAQYEALCKERGVKPVPVIFTDPLPSACLVGVLRPYIALPLTASPADAIHVLTHEVCHLKNHDPLWSLLRLACCVVHWFNPLVWIAANMSRTDAELRCDDRVVRPMNMEQKTAYANVLVLAAARRNAPGVAVLATGMTMTGRRLKTRVLTVLKGRQPLRWLSVLFVVLASMCLVGAFATSELPGTVWENNRPEVPARHVTDGIEGKVELLRRDEAEAYAAHLWREVLGGGVSMMSSRLFEGDWFVEGTENGTGRQWYMKLTESGLVVDFGTHYFDEEISDVPVEEYDRYREAAVDAAAFLKQKTDLLTPGMDTVTEGTVLTGIVLSGDVIYFHFNLMPVDKTCDTVSATVRKTPDGAMELVLFVAQGNG
ncbi:MAG: M56 family metallopeptidase [Clostridia bacterium]|nr:M56 family metallopeptidase [Clostridia bacterium]